MVARGMRQPPNLSAAARSASTSACAVGSARSSRSLPAAASTSPSRATTAPIGTSSCAAARSASWRARRIISVSAGSPAPVMGDKYRQLLSLQPCYSYSMSKSYRPPAGGMCRAVALIALLGGLLAVPAAPASAASPSFARDEVLVHYRGDSGQTSVDVPAGQSVRATLSKLRSDPAVGYARPDYLVHAAV